ncbi:unnamed protein product [Brachionus calyciflorus]|uniref:Cilia- and flagella-associated protein 157 n=1 Tax=Brachionus calyciflorus TaxID=104777 RepID=A0A813VBT2_9BILA|nr:unnamed protein product [Brachionus calyciflorus]
MGKKDKGKGKGKKGKAKKEKVEAEPTEEHVDENTKQFFLLQIKDLEDKLKRYQSKCDEMELIAKKYETQYETSNNDKKDIISNLKKELDKKTDEILDLNDRLVGLQQAKDAEKEAFDKQLTDLRTEFQENKDILTNQNNSLLAKLTALEEFKSQKEELLSKLDSLEKQIEFLNDDHQNKINDIEKKVIIDKDRLKKDMIVKVSQVAAEFRRVSNKQMADTTKRTIKENVSINNQLQKMSDKVMEAIQENDEKKIKEKVFSQQIELLEDNEKELAKKNVNNLKVIRLLTEKCRNQEAIINELEGKYNLLKNTEANNEQLIEQIQILERNLGDYQEENIKLHDKLKIVENELQLSNKHKAKVERILKQATDSLVIALSKNAVSKDSEWNNIEKRDNMLENMLILLNSAASLGFGPNLQAFSSEITQRPRTSEYPGSGKGIRKGQFAPSDFSENSFAPHYKIGDLGIVPRENDHIFTNYEKMKFIYPRKELNNLQKLIKKSVSTQTVDFTKASIFGIDSEDQVHPIYENRARVAPTKTQILMPINGQQRVTDKVF